MYTKIVYINDVEFNDQNFKLNEKQKIPHHQNNLQK